MTYRGRGAQMQVVDALVVVTIGKFPVKFPGNFRDISWKFPGNVWAQIPGSVPGTAPLGTIRLATGRPTGRVKRPFKGINRLNKGFSRKILENFSG